MANSEKESLNVCGILRDDGACGFYRIRQPLVWVNERYGVNAALGGVTCENDNDLFELLMNCDIVLMPRPASDRSLEMIRVCQKMGKKVIIDHDDNIFCLNPMSPHYLGHGTEEVTVMVNGEEIKIWEDGVEKNGKTFSIEENKKKQEAAKEALRIADGVTVTTEHLAGVYREYNDNVYVLPNCIEPDVWQPIQLVKDGWVRISWHGGCSHYEDLLTLQDSITRIAAKHKNVKFVICGHEFKGIFKDVSPDQYEYHGWVPTVCHPYKQKQLNTDIAMIPLKDDLFNVCKSPIKWVEYSCLGIPSVVIDIPPYSPVVRHGETGFLYSDNIEFEKYMSQLIESVELRKKIGENARKQVHREFGANENAYKWAEVFWEVAGGTIRDKE